MTKVVYWVEFVGAVLAIVVALIELPPILIRFGRWVLDNWSLLSHRWTVKRLATFRRKIARFE
jgi:hypothetical protein